MRLLLIVHRHAFVRPHVRSRGRHPEPAERLAVQCVQGCHGRRNELDVDARLAVATALKLLVCAIARNLLPLLLLLLLFQC